ncbi:hypothetical protein MAPG_11720 [Magnaporthiopsis poae ATCC 64411]|uniref:Dihydroxy-acid/6-phosphogluconate dehydratase C-terminal domain-containing protein n=1 Tax=Magnaporthiopsis poae (strain ATCC 64411 / 73-15) TaxID=644358 RepID=A0A0C4EG08_MAGP6|nr:hypothetical protein MAPG_11720 [Magnaporthiopsis poae ATCC 64411]
MLRISDGRMSGTAGGCVVLHVSPEAALPESVLGVAEIRERVRLRADALKAAAAAAKTPVRGYRGLYLRSVNQAQFGADFDFLTAAGC